MKPKSRIHDPVVSLGRRNFLTSSMLIAATGVLSGPVLAAAKSSKRLFTINRLS